MPDSFLLTLSSILLSILLYPIFMIYVALVINVGFFTWLVFLLMLSPYILLWYIVVKKRMLNHLKLLLENKPREWDIEKSLEEYLKLVKKRDEEEQKKT